MTTEDTLSKLVGYFDEAEQSTDTSRQESEMHRDYYDNKQLTENQTSTLESRGQPPVVDNKIKDKIDTLLGMEIEVRTDPKAFPRTPTHEGAAEAATDAIRFVADNNFLPQVKSEVGGNLFIEGTGTSTVTVNKKGNVEVKHVMWDRHFFDPHSRKKDFSDAKYEGEAIWMDLDDAKRKYPGNETEFDSSMADAHTKYDETYGDKPLSKWIDPKRKRVRVLEIYYREKQWMRAVYAHASMLDGPKVSPYLDEEGEPENPYVSRSAYVDRDGSRYGVVRRYLDLQDELNKRRSKMLHWSSARTIVADSGAVDDIELAKKELQKPDGWVTVNPNKKFEVLSHDAEIAAQLQMYVMTDNALNTTGPNAALQGSSGRISGRAKQLDQQAGAVNLGTLFDGLSNWEIRTYRKIWNRIRQFWTDEKWIRVRDDERNLKFVSLNHKKTQGEAFEELKAEALRVDGPLPPQPENPSAPLIDSNGNPVIENNVVDLDVDIIIEQSPDIITIQQEEFKELAQLKSSGMTNIPDTALIEASQLRNKRQILAEMRGDTPEGQQQAQMNEMLQGIQMILAQLSVKEKEAEIAKTESETEENLAQAELHAVEAFKVGEGEEKVG